MQRTSTDISEQLGGLFSAPGPTNVELELHASRYGIHEICPECYSMKIIVVNLIKCYSYMHLHYYNSV